MLEIGT